jgi:hypothetical protein
VIHVPRWVDSLETRTTWRAAHVKKSFRQHSGKPRWYVSYIIILKSIPSHRLQRCWPKIWLFKIIRKSFHRQLKKNKNLSFEAQLFCSFSRNHRPAKSLTSYRNLITKVDNEPDPIEVNVSPLCPSNNPHCHNWETLLITRGFGSGVFWLLVYIM